jgi:hypothetical protein
LEDFRGKDIGLIFFYFIRVYLENCNDCGKNILVKTQSHKIKELLYDDPHIIIWRFFLKLLFQNFIAKLFQKFIAAIAQSQISYLYSKTTCRVITEYIVHIVSIEEEGIKSYLFTFLYQEYIILCYELFQVRHKLKVTNE